MSVDRAAAVRGGGTALTVALDNARVAFALADAGDVDLVAFCEDVGLQDIAHIDGCAVLKTEFLEVLLVADAGLVKVTLFRLRQLLLGDVFKAELDGVIAFLFLGHLRGDRAGARLDHGDGDDLACFIEDLRHADLFADDGFLHMISSFRLLVSSHGSLAGGC